MIVDPEALREEKLAKLNALTDDDMPDLETLDESSDYSGFMSAGVSESLRKMALRKLFQGKTYSFRDGLDDYDGDYTSFAKLDPATITSDMRHMIGVEAKRQLAKEEQERQRLLAEAENVDGSEELNEFVDQVDADDLELADESSSAEGSLIADGSLIERENFVEASKVIKRNDSDNSNNEEVA